MNYEEYIAKLHFDHHMNINFVSFMEIVRTYTVTTGTQDVISTCMVVFSETSNCISVSGGQTFTYLKRTGL